MTIKNLVKTGLIILLMLVLSGCFNEESQKIIIRSTINWMVYCAYILPVVGALMYQINVKNSKWYFTILIAVAIHLIYGALLLLTTPFSFEEILVLFY